MEQSEEWRPVVGWERYYEVSNLGRVRRIQTGHVLKAQYANKRYCVYFEVMGRRQCKTVARLVAEAFLPPPQDAGMYVYHMDLDPANNKADNLYWLHPYFNEEAIANSTVSRRTSECRAKYAALQRRRMQDPVNYVKFTKARKVICLETGVVYPSEQDAAEEFGVARSTVHSSCKNGTPQHWQLQHTGGNPVFHFRYYDPEEWKPKECIWRTVTIPEVAGRYEVSNMGEIRNAKTKQIRKIQQAVKNKAPQVGLFTGKKSRAFLVSQIVAQTFLPKVYGKDVVIHRDGDIHNNCVSNLYWGDMRDRWINIMGRRKRVSAHYTRSVICEETGVMYASAVDAACALHIRKNTITTSCIKSKSGRHHRNRSTKGKPVYHFRYAGPR